MLSHHGQAQPAAAQRLQAAAVQYGTLRYGGATFFCLGFTFVHPSSTGSAAAAAVQQCHQHHLPPWGPAAGQTESLVLP
jgi:hypothetical protein